MDRGFVKTKNESVELTCFLKEFDCFGVRLLRVSASRIVHTTSLSRFTNFSSQRIDRERVAVLSDKQI
jgi:hypothetical protein